MAGWAGSLEYAYYSGTMWVTQTLGTFWDGNGSSLRLDAAGYPPISHFSSGSMATMHTYYDGTTWYSETVDADGSETSLALDAAGFPHLAYPGQVAQPVVDRDEVVQAGRLVRAIAVLVGQRQGLRQVLTGFPELPLPPLGDAPEADVESLDAALLKGGEAPSLGTTKHALSSAQA